MRRPKHNTLKIMDIPELKKGETYYSAIRYVGTTNSRREICLQFLDEEGKHVLPTVFTDYRIARALQYGIPVQTATIPTEPPTLVGTTPKYNPCRKFRKGDIVRYVIHNGRECPAMPLDEYYLVKTLTVVEDEDANHNVLVETQDGRNKYIRFCFLQLVTPVEDVEPYIVEKSNDGATIVWTVKKRDSSQGLDFRYCPGWGGNIFFSETHCRKHAETECDRLNAEYRKEMEK